MCSHATKLTLLKEFRSSTTRAYKQSKRLKPGVGFDGCVALFLYPSCPKRQNQSKILTSVTHLFHSVRVEGGCHCKRIACERPRSESFAEGPSH